MSPKTVGEKLITNQSEFHELCDRIKAEGSVAFDTEFVSEYTFLPELCLLQFNVGGECALVDPQQVRHLDPWWELMLDEETQVLVHGGRAELRFCIEATREMPRNIIDVQVAEGFRSRSYPLGYSNLVQRCLGVRLGPGSTRTDWRRRPLSADQMKYAVEDVHYLPLVWEEQRKELEQLGRLDWLHDECDRQVRLASEEHLEHDWTKLNGLHKLNSKELAVARSLVHWRRDEAEKDNKPLRKVLKDNMIIDIAKRQPKTTGDLLSTRDFARSGVRRKADAIVGAVQEAISLPKDQWPKKRRRNHVDLTNDVLIKILNIALTNRCAEMNIALQLVGTNNDIRDLVREYVMGEVLDERCLIRNGWRETVVGSILTDLLDGKTCLRVGDPTSDYPLVFDTTE